MIKGNPMTTLNDKPTTLQLTTSNNIPCLSIIGLLMTNQIDICKKLIQRIYKESIFQKNICLQFCPYYNNYENMKKNSYIQHSFLFVAKSSH